MRWGQVSSLGRLIDGSNLHLLPYLIVSSLSRALFHSYLSSSMCLAHRFQKMKWMNEWMNNWDYFVGEVDHIRKVPCLAIIPSMSKYLARSNFMFFSWRNNIVHYLFLSCCMLTSLCNAQRNIHPRSSVSMLVSHVVVPDKISSDKFCFGLDVAMNVLILKG